MGNKMGNSVPSLSFFEDTSHFARTHSTSRVANGTKGHLVVAWPSLATSTNQDARRALQKKKRSRQHTAVNPLQPCLP